MITITRKNDRYGTRTEQVRTKKQAQYIWAGWYSWSLDSDPYQVGHEEFTAVNDKTGEVLYHDYL